MPLKRSRSHALPYYKKFMSSISEAELGALLITAQEMIAMRNTLKEIQWPQPKSPIQTDNSATSGIVNNTILPRKFNTIDLHLHWLRCREAQGRFQYYWASGSLNWGGYSTKHHPPLYQKSERMQFAIITEII